MNVIIGLSLVALAVQCAALLTALAVGRAPGWGRLRVLALIAGSGAVYSLVRLAGEILPNREASNAILIAMNLVVGALHLAGWLWYSFSDPAGRWESVPRWVRRAAVGVVGFTTLGALSGRMVRGDFERVVVPWLGVEFGHPRLSVLGWVAGIGIVVLLAICLVEQARQARAGVPGARAIVVGFVIFTIAGFEEVLVAAGVVNFIYLGEVGYLVLVAMVTVQLLARFASDARRLTELSAQLSAEVESAESERDAARDAFLAQERFAALGRIASSVGHEINNPLQYLALNLEALRDHHLRPDDPEARGALAQGQDAVDRIRRIVDGMRAYARTTVPELQPLDLRAVVRSALEATAPSRRTLPPVVERLGEVPRVLGDEGKLVQAVVNAIMNAVVALEHAAAPPHLEVLTFPSPDGDAVIEVRDNGPGFPAELLPRLGEPFVTTRATVGGSGLGLFVVRGIVDAHGGLLVLENARGGGAVLRIQLPAARPTHL